MIEKGRTMPVGPGRTELYRKVSQRIRDQQAAIFAMQLVNLWPKRDTFYWPNLETPGMNNGVQGANVVIRIYTGGQISAPNNTPVGSAPPVLPQPDRAWRVSN